MLHFKTSTHCISSTKSTHVIPLFKSSTINCLSSSPAVKVLHWLVPICFSSLMYHKLSISPSWMFPEHPPFTTPAHLYLGCFYLDHVMCTSTSFQIQLKCRFHFEDLRPHPSFIHSTFISLLQHLPTLLPPSPPFNCKPLEGRDHGRCFLWVLSAQHRAQHAAGTQLMRNT